MKLIDEKGRLFGLINLIDFFVLLFLFAMIPVLYFGYKIIRTPIQGPFDNSIKEISLNCQLIKLKPDIAELISVGDIEKDDEGRVTGEIAELGESRQDKEDPTLKQRFAKLKLKTQFKRHDLYYKGKIIDYNEELVFKTNKYNVIAKVEEDIVKTLLLRITLKNLNEDTVNLIAVGDKEIDDAGHTVVKIEKIGIPEDNSLELDLTSGNFIIGEEPGKKQLPIEALLRCHILKESGENRFYFKDKRITHNSQLKFKTDKYTVVGMVAKTYEFISEKETKWISLTVRFPEILSQIADALKIGDTEEDFLGSPMARVVKVISNKPAEMMVVKKGRIIKLTLLGQRELEVVLDVLCDVRGETYYFKNYAVKMGNPITFSTKWYSIRGFIIGMEAR